MAWATLLSNLFSGCEPETVNEISLAGSGCHLLQAGIKHINSITPGQHPEHQVSPVDSSDGSSEAGKRVLSEIIDMRTSDPEHLCTSTFLSLITYVCSGTYSRFFACQEGQSRWSMLINDHSDDDDNEDGYVLLIPDSEYAKSNASCTIINY